MIKFEYNTGYRKGRLICDQSIFELVRNHFSVPDPNAFHMNRKLESEGSKKRVPLRKYLIGDSGLFDFGMYSEIVKYLITEQITEIEYSEDFTKRLNVGFGDVPLSDELSLPLRDYQGEALSKAFETGCGTIVVGTGGGKSLLQASLLENWKNVKPDFKCVVVVPGLSLVNQLVNDFTNYQVTFTFSGWTGIDPLQDTQVVVVNSENFCAQFSDNRWITDIDVLLNDECHKVKHQNVLTKIFSKIPTPNKFGFTGTLPLTDIDRWKIIGTFGPVIYEKSSKELRDEGFLANVVVKMIRLNHSHRKMSYQNEITYLHNCGERNDLIANIVSKLQKNVLILVNRLDHGENLLDACSTNPNKIVRFISGEMPVEERNEIIKLMEERDDVVCVAMSSIFSVGINVKNLPFIMFVDGGKSFIRTIQSVGRGLRLHENKTKLIIFDIYDDCKYSQEHALERIEFYKREQIEFNQVQMNL